MTNRVSLAARVGFGVLLCAIAGTGMALAASDEQHSQHESGTTRVSKPNTPEPKSPSKSATTAKAGTTKNETKAEQGGSEASSATPTAEEALKWLREGNERWAKNHPQNPNTDADRRAMLAEKGQSPFATVITCSDSRVPAERVFDRGTGDLFVIRVAGNIAGTSEGGTIEYGVEHLHTPVLVVMGHTKCGAVGAAASGTELHGQLGALVDQIKPAIERTRSTNPGIDGNALAAAAIRENVWQTVFSLLKGSKMLREKVKSGELAIVGAVYDIASGEVDFMGPHPWQSELLVALDARESQDTSPAPAQHAEVPEQAPHEQAGHP